jgi:hypothetical protein
MASGLSRAGAYRKYAGIEVRKVTTINQPVRVAILLVLTTRP